MRARPGSLLLPLAVATGIVLVCGLACGALAAERAALVSVARANVRSGPGTGYPVVTTFDQGTRLRILEQSGDWYRIQLPREGHGWVYKEVIALDGEASPSSASPAKAPAAGGGLFDSLKRGFTASRQEEMTAAAGARGLGEEGGSKAGVDPAAVSRMEALSISPSEVRDFAREGRLSPEKLP